MNNWLVYMSIAAAIAQAITIEQAKGGDNATKRANAVKTVLTAISPLIPAAAAHPEFAEHIGLLVDDFVQLGKKVPAVPVHGNI